MSDLIGITASKSWRAYKRHGGTIKSFRQYIDREKAKLSADGENNLMLIDQSLNDSVHNAINDATGLNKKPTGKTVLGIDKTVFIIGSVLFVAGTIYLITRIAKS